MTKRNASAVVVLSLLTVACATTSAPSKAKEVEVVSQPPTDCRVLGPVFGSYSSTQSGSWMATSGQNSVAYARQDLVENAAKQGATHVVFQSSSTPSQWANSGSATGTAYQCPR